MFSAAPAVASPVPAAVPSSVPATADGGVGGSLGLSFGLLDSDLDDLKEQAAAAYAGEGARAKKPKVTHALFFDEDKGFKKMLSTFPKIKFQGKGKEVDDLKLLLKHYEKWFKELHPHGDHFEDLVWKARSVLNEKEKDGDGISSDPKERLHMLRFQYKNSVDSLASFGGLSEDALPSSSSALSDDARQRIEANKKRAMEIRDKKKQEQGGSSGAGGAAEEDMEALWAEAEAMGQAPQSAFDDEDDPFGFGFDMGGATQASGGGTRPTAPAAPDFEDEDPFGFGGGAFDDDEPTPAPKPAVEIAKAPAPVVDPEVARRIAENREKAMARKRKREEEVAAAAESVPAAKEEAQSAAPAASAEAPTATEIAHEKRQQQPTQMDEEPFGFGGGLDDP